MALQSFRQDFTKNGLHPVFDEGLKLPLMLLAAGADVTLTILPQIFHGFPELSEDWRKPMSAWLGKIFYFAVRSCLACAS